MTAKKKITAQCPRGTYAVEQPTSDGCNGCVFDFFPEPCFRPRCMRWERRDGLNVIFKRIKK
jgi:hypothetical protein